MKRFHVHLHVQDLPQNIGFYSRLFAAEPARLESDCAKWMPEDPALNFATSTQALGMAQEGLRSKRCYESAVPGARAPTPALNFVFTVCDQDSMAVQRHVSDIGKS